MNIKRFLIAGVAVYVVFEVLDFIVHGLILSSTYETMMDVFRPQMENYMWIMYITGLVFAFLFVYIYTKGREGKGVAEGIRYGFIMGLFMLSIGMFNQYAVYEIPLSLAVQWFVYGMIQFMICGAVASLIYKS